MIRMNTGRKWFIKAAALACAAMLMTPLTAFAGWQKEGDTYAYYEEDGTRVVNDSVDQAISGFTWMKTAIF